MRMKNHKMIAFLLLTAVAMFAGCRCRHEWKDATCTEPKTCVRCGITEGEALGHSWVDATCTMPKTCAKCGAKEGAPSHVPGKWEKEDGSVIGGKEIQKCELCGKAVSERRSDRSARKEVSLFTANGFPMTTSEFADHLICYLPDDTVISMENKFDDSPWFPDSTFSIVSADLNRDSRYIRVWYAKGEGEYEDHIDAYFDKLSDFRDIAKDLFEAIDPQYAKSGSFQKDIETILNDLSRQTQKTKSLETNHCFFVYSYTAPYTIFGTRYPGFYEIRFLSKPFYRDKYQ